MMRKVNVMKTCCYIVITLLVMECLFVNISLLYLFVKINNEISAFRNLDNFSLENIVKHFKMEGLLYTGRQGGFASLIKQVVGRVHSISYPLQNQNPNEPIITFFGVDVSQNGEASLLIRRISSRKDFPYTRMIVDIGANDGLLSSNSFNFIHWGWSAVLVEPQIQGIQMAKINTFRNVDVFNDRSQNITYVNSVIGSRAGTERFVISSQSFNTESHIYSASGKLYPGDRIMEVESITVPLLAKKYNIPQNFGILSVDTEGKSHMILNQWMKNGYRPAYIIVEMLKEKKSLHTLQEDMETYGYRVMSKIGWNAIFEHKLPKHRDDKSNSNNLKNKHQYDQH